MTMMTIPGYVRYTRVVTMELKGEPVDRGDWSWTSEMDGAHDGVHGGDGSEAISKLADKIRALFLWLVPVDQTMPPFCDCD